MIVVLRLFHMLALVGLLLVSGVSRVSAQEPVAQSPARLSIIANDFTLPSKFRQLAEWGEAVGVTVQPHYVETAPENAAALLDADLVILDTPRGNDRAQVMGYAGAALKAATTPWIAVGGGPPKSGNLPPDIARRLHDYYGAGGKANLTAMLAFVRAWKMGDNLSAIAAPAVLPDTGVYHPDAPRNFTSVADYLAWGQGRWSADAPRLGVAIATTYISNAQTGVIDEIVRQAEAAGVVPIMFWFDGSSADGLTGMIGDARPNMLVNMTHMLNAEARKAEFAALDVPVVIGLMHRGVGTAEWRAGDQGIEPRMTASMVATPEGWGMSDPLVLGALDDGDPTPLPEQVALLVGRTKTLAKLQTAPRDTRNIALLFWNTPSGERNLSASHLNVPKSIEAIAGEMARQGFAVTPADEQAVITNAQRLLAAYYRPETLDALLAEGLAITLPLAEYRTWLATLPPRIESEVTARWGAPADHWSVRQIAGEPSFVIPAWQLGKLLVLPQPPRADRLGDGVHDLKQPPGHLYLAAYLALRKTHMADAIVHLGTHGTQEWTPGKDRGLSALDYPFLTLGDVPVIYPYIQDNVAEAIQAKRRGRAVVVSHQTPAFAPSGFYDELRDIHDLMHQYEQLDAGAVRDQTAKKMMDAAIAANIHKDLGWDEARVRGHFAGFTPVLHDHLHQLAQAVTPLGLHSFGTPAEADQRVMTVMQQLGEPYYRALGLDVQEMFAKDWSALKTDEAFLFLKRHVDGTADPATIGDPELRAMIEQGIANERHLAEPGELETLIAALDGRFVAAGPGGDPVRNPDSSSGTNLYAFEPDKIPTRSAYEAGGDAYAALVEAYRRDHEGVYPDKLAFSLWSSETIRTLGIMEGQILHAMGLRPSWDKGGRVTGFDIIPSAELGRPRVDAVLQVTSVYRDQFDGLMRNLGGAIDRLAVLDEPGNAIAANSAATRTALIERGIEAGQAARFASIRMFSNPPGDYGSNVPDVAMDSTKWDDNTVLADTFFASQSHAYGAQDWGTPVGEAELLQAQLKGVDAAILSRSSNLHGLLSTDHPFEYLGGLSIAARSVNGTHPALYIGDFRTRTPRVTAASQYLSTELRTRYQNPQWITAMKDEGYAGTVEMLKVVNNLFGWQTVDPNMVRADQWQAMHDTYVMDRRNLGLDAWFEKHNATGQAQIIERMTEAIRKGYWDASAQTRRELAERWRDLTERKGADRGAEKTTAFLEDMARGFDIGGAPARPQASALAAASPAPAAKANGDMEPEADPAAPGTVRGRVMEEVVNEPPVVLPPLLSLLLQMLLVGVAAAGAVHFLRIQRAYPALGRPAFSPGTA